MTKNAVDTEIVDRHAPTEFCRWIVSNFNHGKLVRSNVLEETSHLPGRQAFPLSQVPHSDSDLPICRSRAEGGERVGVLGDAGQPVPVPVQAAEERFGKHTLQLYCIQCTLVFSLRLERVFHRTENIILYIYKR